MMEAVTHWLQRQVIHKKTQETKCLCCGDCCKEFGWHLNACKTDLARWRQEGREDLLARVNRLGWIWIDPVTGQLEQQCPFLEQQNEKVAVCGIQQTKPQMCRDYPTLAHGRRCLHGVFL